jgi:hypothetical protein
MLRILGRRGADDYPTRQMQLRPTEPHDRGATIAHCDVSLLGVSTPHGRVTSNQARFSLEQVSSKGKTSAWTRSAESGNTMLYHFCPTCGSTVFWENDGFPGHISVAIGNFADPTFPAPTVAVWEETRHPWLSLPSGTPPKRAPKQG